MDLDERQLRAFLAVVETGSLGRAAKMVNLTQPSLSRLIQTMERRLGHPLFERRSRGMTLCAAGDVLLPHARHLVFEMQTIRDELAALRGLKRGTVRIGVIAVIARRVIPDVLAKLFAQSPSLKAELIEDADDALIEALLRRSVDLVVTSSRTDHEDVHLVGRPKYTDDYSVFCSREHPISDAPSLRQVFKEGWVTPRAGSMPRVQFENLVRELEQGPPIVSVEVTSPDSMIAVVRQTRLLCWLPEPLMEIHLREGAVRRLTIPQLTGQREFFLYRRRNGLLPDAARRFLDFFPLREE